MSDWIHGETGGYLRHCTETRNWFETDYPRLLEEAGAADRSAQPLTEHASYIIEALETGRPYRGHFNVKNDGLIANLPADAIVESPGFVDRFGLNMVAGITLPEACAATCIASINVQRMAVHAAIDGRRRASEARGPARSAGRRDLLARRGLADGRRDAASRRPNGCRNTPHAIDDAKRRLGAQERRHAGLAGRRAARRAPDRDRPQRTRTGGQRGSGAAGVETAGAGMHGIGGGRATRNSKGKPSRRIGRRQQEREEMHR